MITTAKEAWAIMKSESDAQRKQWNDTEFTRLMLVIESAARRGRISIDLGQPLSEGVPDMLRSAGFTVTEKYSQGEFKGEINWNKL